MRSQRRQISCPIKVAFADSILCAVEYNSILVLICRAALSRRGAKTLSRRPRHSQYTKAAVETPDVDYELPDDDEPRHGVFSTVDLDDTLSQRYDFD